MAQRKPGSLPAWVRWLGGNRLETVITLARWAGLDVEKTWGIKTAYDSEDTEALLLHRDPEAMLLAYEKVLTAPTVLAWAWDLGSETFFSYNNPLTQALFKGKHPRLQRLEGVLIEARRRASAQAEPSAIHDGVNV